jgi:hypothetical protein
MRLLSVALCLGLALPAQAQTIPPGSCYLRDYSDSHLAKHPEQTVTLIALGPETGADEADAPILRLAVQKRGSREIFRGVAYCDGWRSPMSCMMEGDMGLFRLERTKDGVRLTVHRAGVTLEGRSDFVTLYGDRGDDIVFAIPRVPADACP